MAYLGLSGLTDKEVNDSVPRMKAVFSWKSNQQNLTFPHQFSPSCVSKLLYNLSRFGSARPYF